ncbi:PucR family transcriptional regulator [Arthrobacter sp. E918]|uniref:PucR family transcriptional regulator n=2 Tax=Arthrobacter mobilis TaxID=2724944 RepID=A0A7X6HET9_9MICC|nr:PucR family transcriptional regulator [Arthrobacter mobilis]
MYGEVRGPALPARDFRPGPSAEPEWTELIRRLWQERGLLVSDFLGRFSAISYGEALVPEEDVYRTAVDTMDMFLYQLAGQELPPDLRTLPRDVAIRRARQGVPLDAFLEAVRNDFRVLWKGLERVARDNGISVLVANMDRVLDSVEGYVSHIQQAFSEEEALLARNKQLYRQRLLSRLFQAEAPDPEKAAEIAASLGVQPADTFEVLAVTGDGATQALRQYEADHRTFVYEATGAVYLFRPERAGRTWRQDPPGFDAGYLDGVGGLAAVPAAAASARVLAGQRLPGLATVEDSWMGIAGQLLEGTLPGFSAPVRRALDACMPHERQRLLQVARSYARTGSVKETSEELYCHRNTVVNRLHSLQEVIGLDLTVPAEAARALVALSLYDGPREQFPA